MKTVELSYNPYFQETGLKIDGKKYDNPGSRIGEFVLGKAMDNWLDKKVASYQRWDGFLPELMEYLNDDELEIIFAGDRDDFDRVKDGLSKQHGTIREKGFEPERYTLAFCGKRKPEEIRNNIQRFMDNRKRFVPTQKCMMDMDYLAEELIDLNPCTVERLRDIVQRLFGVVDEIICGCTDEKYAELWKNARRELLRICS